jgi:hypothetical protein
MNNIKLELLKRISITNITLLKDVNKHIQINKNGKFNYFYIPNLDYNKIIEFIENLEDDSFYTVIPILSMHGKDGDPHIILSKQILVSSFSNPNLINHYLIRQLDKTLIDFDFNLDNKFHYLIFKYKKVEINI